MKINGAKDEFSLVLAGALRYGLGRRTYITGAISSFIIANAEFLPTSIIYSMLEDIRDAVTTGRAGDQIDIDGWERCAEALQEQLKGKGVE